MADLDTNTGDITIYDASRTEAVTLTTDGNKKRLDVSMATADGPELDAFGRLRVSNPLTIFDSKQIFDNAPLFWDESLETGSGITSAHSVDEAASTFTSTLNTAGKFTRQTFMRFNYQPGKSQLILMTGILDNSGGGTGVERRIGYFDDDNGLFFEDDNSVVGVVRRTNVTGTPVDTRVAQSSWNLDVMDGTGPSGVTVDWTKTQIFLIDFEWLGVGRVRLGLNINGMIFYVHQFLNANVLDKVFMSTPNLPLRYQMETTGSSPASTMVPICSTVISEGDKQEIGSIRYFTTAETEINADTIGVLYVICGIRLKTTHLAASIKLVNITLINTVEDDFEWVMVLNPTIATPITFANETNSAVQTGPGNAGAPSTSTATGGTLLTGGLVKAAKGAGSVDAIVPNAILLGAAIDGTRDEIYLCARPFTANANIHGSLSWREIL